MEPRGSQTACPHPKERRRARADGFTLIELLLVVALIGVLASIAVPSATKFRMRTQRAEALMVLKGIHTAQAAYHFELGHYAPTFDELGFDLDGGVAVDESTIDGNAYRFEMGTYDYDGTPDGNFWATGTADLVKGGALDVLLIENDVIIEE